MPITTHNYEIGRDIGRTGQKCLRNAGAGTRNSIQLNIPAVAREDRRYVNSWVCAEILVARLWINDDDCRFICALKKMYRIAQCSRCFSRGIPSHDDMAHVDRAFPVVWNQEHRPSRGEQCTLECCFTQTEVSTLNRLTGNRQIRMPAVQRCCVA